MVVHFGGSAPAGWTPKRFPKMVLLHMGPLPVIGSLARSFNFNKMRAMIIARIKVGVQLDADQFVAPGVDAIFGAHSNSTLSAALGPRLCSVSWLRLRVSALPNVGSCHAPAFRFVEMLDLTRAFRSGLCLSVLSFNVLDRTAEEITQEYPIPIMPSHFADRSPKVHLAWAWA